MKNKLLSLLLGLGIVLLTSQNKESGGPEGESFNIKTDLLGLEFSRYILPEDFTIGPLTDPRILLSDEKDIYDKVVNPFFQDLLKGKIDETFIQPETSLTVKNSVQEGLFKEGKIILTEYRLGPIYVSGKTARARIKMVSGKGIASGNIYFINQKNNWVISDIEIDYNDFSEEQKKEGVFSPASLSTF